MRGDIFIVFLAVATGVVLLCALVKHDILFATIPGEEEHARPRSLRSVGVMLTPNTVNTQSRTSADWVTEQIAMSTLRRSWLPAFGGDSSSTASPSSPPEDWPGDDSVPVDVAEHRIVKAVPKLPYRTYDHFDLGGALGRIRERRVLSLKNDVAEIRIDPQHGGKILSYQVRGKEQIFRNPIFQPGMLGVLGAWTSGGIEFNWPMHGHSVFTTAPVFLATYESPDLGTVVRIYEFDRILNSTWQVDIALVGEHFAIHPRVVNTNAHAIDGYWWTNIGAKLTDSTRVFYNNAPFVLRNGGPKGDYLAPFPMLSDNMQTGVAIEGNTSAFATDHSFPRNNYKACEMFLRPDSHLNKTSWMASAEENGTGFVHTQPSDMDGRKYWVWGQDPADAGRMNFLSRCKVKNGQPSVEDCEGSYLELQAGPAPTQNNFFPLERERSWTEVLMPLDGIPGTHNPGASGYAHGLGVVDKVVENEASMLERVDRILSGSEKLGPGALKSWRVLHTGTGFGLVHERLLGQRFAPSLSFDDAKDPEAEPWLHLLATGQFSEEDLKNVAPNSFMVDWPYVERLRKSKESWLQQLHLGIALRQQGQSDKAHEAFLRSVTLRPVPNPMALMLLNRFEEAWHQVANASTAADPDLIADVAEAWVTSLITPTGVKKGLASALREIEAHNVESQSIRSAQVAQLVYRATSAGSRSRKCQEAVQLLLTSEWAVSDGSLTRLWRDAWYCIEGANTSYSKHQSRVAHPPPRFIDFNGAT